MAIHYNIEESSLKNNEGYVAKVKQVSIVDKERLLTLMEQRGTNYTKPTLAGALVLLEDTIMKCLREGSSVNINNFIKFGVSIKGVFSDLDCGKEIKPEHVRANVSISKSFNAKFQQDIKLKRFFKGDRQPYIRRVIDGATEEKNKVISIDSIIRIEGKELKFDPTKEDEGIFLDNIKKQQVIKIVYRDVIKSDELRFLLKSTPWENGEEVYLRLRRRYDGGTLRERAVGPFILKGKVEQPCYEML